MFKTFLSRKFFSLLLSSTIGQLVITVLTLSDSVIAGVMLGEDAEMITILILYIIIRIMDIDCYIGWCNRNIMSYMIE